MLEKLPVLKAEGKYDEYISLATDAALRSEKLTCKMRHLLYYCTGTRKHEYLNKAAEVQGMSVRNSHDMLEVIIPGLLPKRNPRESSEFLSDALYFMLERYTAVHPVKRFERAVVCFVHEYDRMNSRKLLLDYDNIEKKQMLDVITTFFLLDDSGLCCETYHMTSIGETDKTRILVMSRERFVTWVTETATDISCKCLLSFRDSAETLVFIIFYVIIITTQTSQIHFPDRR